MATRKLTVSDLSFTHPRQKELMRVLLKKMSDYQKRGQTHFTLNGMSTSHLTLKCIEDHQTMFAFWPAENTQWNHELGDNVHMIDDGTMTKLQSTIRDDIKKLVRKGYIEEMGNENERRYRPNKELIGQTL